MKQLISNYTFNPTGKTIVFNDYTSLYLRGLLLITNISDPQKTVLYQFNDSGLTATVIGNVVVLGYDTSSMNSNDVLQIFYDDGVEGATDSTIQALLSIADNMDNSIELLKRIAKILEPISTQDSQMRQKVIIDGTSAVTLASTTLTSGTVTTVGSVTNVAGIDYRWLIFDQARNTYSNSIRKNLTF